MPEPTLAPAPSMPLVCVPNSTHPACLPEPHWDPFFVLSVVVFLGVLAAGVALWRRVRARRELTRLRQAWQCAAASGKPPTWLVSARDEAGWVQPPASPADPVVCHANDCDLPNHVPANAALEAAAERILATTPRGPGLAASLTADQAGDLADALTAIGVPATEQRKVFAYLDSRAVDRPVNQGGVQGGLHFTCRQLWGQGWRNAACPPCRERLGAVRGPI